MTPKPHERRILCCECPACGALPGAWCISNTGRVCKSLHAHRIARANGLKASPRSGMYQRPLASRGGMHWTEIERAAFKAAGLELPS